MHTQISLREKKKEKKNAPHVWGEAKCDVKENRRIKLRTRMGQL